MLAQIHARHHCTSAGIAPSTPVPTPPPERRPRKMARLDPRYMLARPPRARYAMRGRGLINSFGHRFIFIFNIFFCKASCEVQRSVLSYSTFMASHLVGRWWVPHGCHCGATLRPMSAWRNRRRQCFRGQRQLLWYADSTPCWSQDHSLPSALILNDAVAYPARTPHLASGSAIKDRVVEPLRELIWRHVACIRVGNALG